MTKPAIVVRNLSKAFGRQNVLRDISLSIAPRESVVIIGRSGCGKSVLVKCILGLLAADSGSVLLSGLNIRKASRSQLTRVRRNVGMLFQNGALFDSMTVAENILFPVRTRQIKPVALGAGSAYELVVDCLARVGLTEEFMSARPADLSGGQRKRVGLARAIVTAPGLLFFDEPTTGLDPVMSHAINDLLASQTRKLAATTVTITHDMGTVDQIATRVVLLDNGTIVWDGSRESMQAADHPLLKSFLDYRGAA